MCNRGRWRGAMPMALLLASASSLGAAQTWQQDRLVIGFWGDPPVNGKIAARYRDVLNAHFNLALGGMGADTPDKARVQRDTCEKLGLKVLFSTYGLPIDALCKCDTTYGFLVRDHPSASEFPAVRERADEVRHDRPGKLPFVNLLPSTAGPDQWGSPTYHEYLVRFVDTAKPEVLCFDHYPLFPEGRDAYCENLDLVRHVSLEAGVPFWNFFKAMACDTEVAPTEAQIRWQVFASMAYGATGVLYFAYWTPANDLRAKGEGLVASGGSHTERYAIAQRLNAELHRLAPTLLALTSTDVRRVNAESSALEGSALHGLDPAAGDFLVGSFRHADGRAAALVMNYADGGPGATASIEFGPGSAVEVSKTDGREAPVADAAPETQGLQLVFQPGDGRLFLIRH